MCCANEKANPDNSLPKAYCNLNFRKEITTWDEAIPLGNGETGCLIWGNSGALRFSLDRGDIWDRTPSEEFLEEDFCYSTMVKLAKERNADELHRKFCRPYDKNAAPTKLPAGKLIFDFGESTAIHSSLDLATASAKVEIFRGEGEPLRIDSYLHARDKIGVIHISAPLSDFSFRLENPAFGVRKADMTGETGEQSNVNTSSLWRLCYDVPTVVDTPEEKYFIQPITPDFQYGIFVHAGEKDGESWIIYRVATSLDGESWVEEARKLVMTFGVADSRETFASHQDWWKQFWFQSGLSLPDKRFEKNWYLTNYFLASCSRKGSYPMPLQGVWTADNGSLPPWKGDYHNDLNTQMSYLHYGKANHLEEGESFLDFLWKLVPKARDFAKNFYGTGGLCLPSVMAIDGTPLGGWPMYSFSPTNQLWTCQIFERHYRATGDLDFLRERAYPYIAESAQCVLELMKPGKDGKLYLPASSSPEIHSNSAESWLTPNSNYDLSLIRYAVTQLIEFSNILSNGKEERWQDALNRLPELAVNGDHVLMLSPDESLQESHRHFSHAMAVFPLRLMDMEDPKSREIINATITNLEVLGTGVWTGFSFTWMAELYAVQGNGNGAAYQLEVFWRNCCSQNGFHLNDDYKRRGTSSFHHRPFTLEGNMCAADALQEMLLYSERGVLRFFPAIPDEWAEEPLSFRDFLAGNGLLVSAGMEDGKISFITLKPRHSGTVLIRDWGKLSHLTISGGVLRRCGTDAEVTLTAGKTCTFR